MACANVRKSPSPHRGHLQDGMLSIRASKDVPHRCEWQVTRWDLWNGYMYTNSLLRHAIYFRWSEARNQSYCAASWKIWRSTMTSPSKDEDKLQFRCLSKQISRSLSSSLVSFASLVTSDICEGGHTEASIHMVFKCSWTQVGTWFPLLEFETFVTGKTSSVPRSSTTLHASSGDWGPGQSSSRGVGYGNVSFVGSVSAVYFTLLVLSRSQWIDYFVGPLDSDQ